jgi:hypothetical protein
MTSRSTSTSARAATTGESRLDDDSRRVLAVLVAHDQRVYQHRMTELMHLRWRFGLSGDFVRAGDLARNLIW